MSGTRHEARWRDGWGRGSARIDRADELLCNYVTIGLSMAEERELERYGRETIMEMEIAAAATALAMLGPRGRYESLPGVVRRRIESRG